MSPRLKPWIQSKGELHEQDLWVKEEVFRFYVDQRRQYCTYLEILDLWLQLPYCGDCIQARHDYTGGFPDVSGQDWAEELADHLGDSHVEQIQETLAQDEEPAGIPCFGCHREIAPWAGDELYVFMEHVEERFGIPLETPGQVASSTKVRNRVIRLYGTVCFACGTSQRLHIDHIRPRVRGGDAAFRNLQPLCEACGNKKGDVEPEEVSVYSDMYFNPPPSDSFEGMFWD